MCIAHLGWCECEPVRIPTVGADESWRIMGNRFRFAHCKQFEVYNRKVIDNCSMVTGRKVYSGMAFEPPVPIRKPRTSVPSHLVCPKIETPAPIRKPIKSVPSHMACPGIEPPAPIRNQRKGVHSMQTPTQVMQRHTSKRHPFALFGSCNVYSPFNGVKRDPLFPPNTIKTHQNVS